MYRWKNERIILFKCMQTVKALDARCQTGLQKKKYILPLLSLAEN